MNGTFCYTTPATIPRCRLCAMSAVAVRLTLADDANYLILSLGAHLRVTVHVFR